MIRSFLLSLLLLLGFVADAQLLNHQVIKPGAVTIPDPPDEPIYFPTMQYGTYASGIKNEWWIAFLPSEYSTVGSTTNYKTVYWWNGDGGDGNATAVTNQNLSGSGTSWSGNFTNGGQEVAWGTVVIKVSGVEVARGRYNGTIIGNGVSGTMNHTSNNGSFSVTFSSTPGATPTIDYVYSPVFEAGLPRYLNRGDTLDGKTIVFIVHKETDDSFYNVTQHFDNARSAAEGIFRIDTDRRIAAGLSRGAVFCRQLLIDRNSQIAGTILVATDISGTIPWSDLYDRGQMWISGQTDATTSPPNSNYMNAIGSSHTGFRYFPSFTLYDATGHTSSLWDTNAFNRSTAPWDWVQWASLWNLDIDKQTTQHVELAETTLSIDDYRAAYRAVSFLSAGATKTALQTRLSTLKTTIDAGRKRWYIDAGALAPSTPGVNQAANFNTGQTYSNLPDDNGNATSVGFQVVAQMIGSGTNRVSDATRTGVAGFGFSYDEYFDFAQVGNVDGSVKWTGLNSGKTYKVTIYAAGGNGTVTNDINISATVSGFTRSIFTQLTNTRKLQWTGISPNGSNEIVISSINNDGNTIGAGIQVFMLEEEN
jgi:hypothetical protein